MATRPPSVPIDDDDVQRQKLAQAIVPASSKKINAVRPLPQQRTMQRPEQRPRSMRRKLGKGSQRGSNRKKTKGVSNTIEDGPSNNAIMKRHPTAFEVISSISDIHSGWPIEDITIRNRSYYYRNNRLFGVERMRFQSVQFNKHSGQWEARYFNVLPFATTKEATRAKFDPKYKEGPYDENKLHALEIKLPTTKTERAARKLVRKAMAERDAPPKVKYGVSNDKIDPVTHLQTHFTLKVVSTKFAGKDLFERFAIIYRALLDLLEVDQGADVDVRTQWKGYGMVGPKVRSLPQYRYMREEVVLMALTPHQWKPKKYSHHPNEHKYGRSRLEPSEVDDKAVVLQSSKFERLMQMENKCKAPDPHKRNQTSTKKKYGAVQKKKKADRDQGGFLDNFGVAIYAAMKEEKERKKVRRKEAEQTQDKNTSSTMVNRLLHLINKSSSRSPDQRKSRNKPTAGKGNKARSKDQQPKSDSQEIAVVPEADNHASRSLGIDRPRSATVPHTAKRQSRPTSPSVMRSRPNSPSTVRSRPNSANLRKSRPNSPTARQSSTAFGPTAETGVTPEQQMKDILESVRFSVRSLQRLYRQRLRRRFLRWWFRVHHLATLISRFYRGYCARVYVHSFRKVRSEACVVIQSVWRGHYSRQWTRKFRAQRLRALSVLQPVMSAWLLRQRLSFAAKNRLSATHIQRLVRGHFGRTRTIQVLGMRYFCAVLVPASTRCQALFRGHRDRTFIRNVVLPSSRHRLSTHRAILSSQKRLRGLWSRRRTAKLRERVAAAQRVQAVFHGWRARVLARALRLRRKRNHNASIIQRIGRGFIAREFARELRDIRYHKTVRIPASITVQKVYRSYAVRERARKALIEWNAAQKMVTFWRFCKAMIVFHKRWLEHLEERRFHLAALFQKIVRGYQARQYANTLRRTQHGDRVKAVFPLQNAWRKFAARRTMERQRVVAEDHWSKKCLAETDEDIQHYSGKIRRLQQRVANAVRARKVALSKVAELSHQRRSNETRIPQIEYQLQTLDEDEVERGWADALEEEWDQKTNGTDMLNEEILQLRIRIKKCDDAIEADTLEIEGLEVELEECLTESIEEHQLIRNREIDRLETTMRRDYAKAVSRQRKVWKIREGARKKTVARMAAAAKQKQDDEKPKPSVPAPVFLSMAHSRMAAHERAKADKEAKLQIQRDRQRYVQAKQAGEQNPLIPAAFDRVVDASHQVLLELDFPSTLGRRNKDPGGDTSGMCLECGKMHCTCKPPDDQIRLF